MENLSHKLASFLFEVGILSQLPRSGFAFLGHRQSIAEHTHRAVYVGMVLASMEGDVDMNKVMKMCLFHDLAESRTGDINHLNQQYVERNEDKAVSATLKGLPFQEDVKELIAEYEARVSKEAILAKDADVLELLLSLKELLDMGNLPARRWVDLNLPRLKTDSAKQLAQQIMETQFDEWWASSDHTEWVKTHKR